MLNRRDFLRRASAGGAAMLGVSSLRVGALSPNDIGVSIHSSLEQLSRIGVQLYTVRNQMRESVEKTLEQVARIGYKEVEFAGYFGRTPQQIRSILDANGLTSPSAHSASMPAIRQRLSQLIDEAAIIGQKHLICASIPRDEMTADGFKKVAGELNRAGEMAAKSKITFGFHNHADDLAPLGSTTGYDILLTECDPKVTSMQMDIFWLVKGGKDPLAYIDRYPGRFYSVHVKDMDASGKMVDAGAGTIPFGKIFAQAKKAGLQNYFVEHDDPGDPMASIEASYRNLRALRF